MNRVYQFCERVSGLSAVALLTLGVVSMTPYTTFAAEPEPGDPTLVACAAGRPNCIGTTVPAQCFGGCLGNQPTCKCGWNKYGPPGYPNGICICFDPAAPLPTIAD